VPELGLPEAHLAVSNPGFLNASVASEYTALQVIGTTFAGGPAELKNASDEDGRMIREMGKGHVNEPALKNALATVQKPGFAAWFPPQKSPSEWMEDAKAAGHAVI